MAKIMFISVNDVDTAGVRALSAYLKQNRHQSYIAFLKIPVTDRKGCKKIEPYDWVGINEKGKEFRYARGPDVTYTEKKLLLSLIEDIRPDIIGFSVTTPLKPRIANISHLIKDRFNIPIIWGGPDPTVDAQGCLNHCDFVCIGEGEKVILDIANRVDNKKDIRGVMNIAYLQEGQFIQNPLYPLVTNLDELPFKDMDRGNKFLIEDDRLTQDFDKFEYEIDFSYHASSSRGCPFACAYCNENFYKQLYARQNFLRRRSPANIIEELKPVKKIAKCNKVLFTDEIFCLDYNWLKEFNGLYRREINIPFICYIYPSKDIDKQSRLLKEAGLFRVCLGVQSGSERINKQIFNRPFDRGLLIKTANILKSMGIDSYSDVITYNPFETEEDLEATLDTLNHMPKPFGLCVNKLYLIKGTRIYDMVKNLDEKKQKGSVSEKTFNYYTRLFWLTRRHNRFIVNTIHKMIIFKYLPFLLTCFLALAVFVKGTARKASKIFEFENIL